jgi:nickel/cobalt transporter (NicO) family protein
MRIKIFAVMASSLTLLMAHPLGNFSANHYMRFEVGPHEINMRYVMDLAEIPTFELLRDWGLDRTSPEAEMRRKATEQARTWMSNLSIRVDGRPVHPVLEGADVVIADGAGNLPILRITAKMNVRQTSGRLEYEDRNYEGRAGWKEIVVAANHARLKSSSQGDQDRSNALTAYPPDPMLAPPQDLRAEFQWASDAPVIAGRPIGKPPKPLIRAIPQPASKMALPSSAATAQNAPAGAVIRNDFLSRTLHRTDIPLQILLAAVIVAFALGAAHALTPGHGKTIMAAYLVGSRGTMKHAAFLGLMVTMTHTISVFALGLATLFLFHFIVPEKITEILGVISGLSIAIIGGGMLWKRISAQRNGHHHHDHDHDHDHHHDHPHTHDHAHSHDAGHEAPHHHGPGGHTHVPAGEITWGSLTTLAVSGGLVPCESALVLLLGAIALGRVGLGLLLLISFSLGLAGVLMGIGAIVLSTKRVLPKRIRNEMAPWMRWTPIASAGVVVLLGIIMTGVSLGWLPSGWLAG